MEGIHRIAEVHGKELVAEIVNELFRQRAEIAIRDSFNFRNHKVNFINSITWSHSVKGYGYWFDKENSLYASN